MGRINALVIYNCHTRAQIKGGGGGGYTQTNVLLDEFFLNKVNSKDIGRLEHKYRKIYCTSTIKGLLAVLIIIAKVRAKPLHYDTVEP